MVVKNKSISLPWELNTIFMQIVREKNYIALTSNMVIWSRVCKLELTGSKKKKTEKE